MRAIPMWVNKIQEPDRDEPSCVNSLCYSPDGTQLIVAAGYQVMVYDPADGAVIRILKGHREKVYHVAYSNDGKKIATGGSDKTVVIWNNNFEGVLKYTHNEGIQCLSFNPVTHQLVSCGATDFAFWSNDVRAVQKYKVGSSGGILACSWSVDGQLLALVIQNTHISVRNKAGEETLKINLNGNVVWAILWTEKSIIVSDWTMESISFFNNTGEEILRPRSIGIKAVCLRPFGELILASGVGGWLLMTSEGVPIIQMKNTWIWCIQASVNNTVALGCADGSLWSHQFVFNTVHGLYRDRYAFRQNMTDVFIQNLTSGSKVRIKCHDRVLKIAIYKNRLAVQLPERVVVYELDESDNMQYKVKEKIPQTDECSLLVATNDSLLLCQEARLTVIGGKGLPKWKVPASIRYVKVSPISNKEVLLLGLSNGQIWKVEMNVSTPEFFIKTPVAVRCFDLSAASSMIAVVDENSICRVYSIPAGQLMFTEENISSVAWHISCEELLSLSGGGMLTIKAGTFPASSQPLLGSVVGFQGGKIFCLQANAMQTINIPLSHAMQQYIDNKMFREAYNIACLGITSAEWETLGHAALLELSTDVARKAFQRSENMSYLFLIDTIEEKLRSEKPPSLAVAEVLAYRGKFADAARIYRANSQDEYALSMYSDLRVFHKAQEYLGSGDSVELVVKKAEWAKHINEPHAAAEMFLAAGDIKRATEIMAENGWVDMLMETGRNIDKGSTDALKAVAEALHSSGHLEAAAEVYQRLGDQQAVILMTVKSGNWRRAFYLAKLYPQFKREVFLPYAHLMAKDNHFIEAQKAYYMGGETQLSINVLEVLIKNSTLEERFKDASYLYWLLASQCLEMANKNPLSVWCQKYYEHHALAVTYFAYDYVHQSIHEPFSVSQPETLFNAAKLVLSTIEDLDSVPPKGISLFCVYLCLAKQGRTLGGNKLARQMLDRLQYLKIPTKLQENLEVMKLLSWTGGYMDGYEITPLCYRCSKNITPLAVECKFCKHRFYFSILTFETLPLVAFETYEYITDHECIELIESTPVVMKDVIMNSENVVGIDIYQIEDPFDSKNFEGDREGKVVLSPKDLKGLDPATILIVKRLAPLNNMYFRNLMPEIYIYSCKFCHSIFYIDDSEPQMTVKRVCGFCRSSTEKDSDAINEILSPILTPNPESSTE